MNVVLLGSGGYSIGSAFSSNKAICATPFCGGVFYRIKCSELRRAGFNIPELLGEDETLSFLPSEVKVVSQ